MVKKRPFSAPKSFGGNRVVDLVLRNGLVGVFGAVLTKSRAIQGWVWCHKTKGQSDS